MTDHLGSGRSQAVTACVVGSLNADLILDVEHLPAEGETVLGSSVHRAHGGKGHNQAVALGRLGALTSMLGRVGDDHDGGALRDSLANAGVVVDRVSTDAVLSTGLAVIALDPAGRNSICVIPGANTAVEAAMVDEYLRASPPDVVLAQLEIPPAVAEAAMCSARAAGRLSVLNAAPAQRLSERLLSLVDVLVVNEGEACTLLGLESWPAAEGQQDDIAQRLVDSGPLHVVITRAEQGCLVAGESGITRISAHRVQVVDTTGAGDCFVAALALRLVEGAAITEAAEFASAAAALAVTQRSAAEGMPTRAEVEQFLATAPIMAATAPGRG